MSFDGTVLICAYSGMRLLYLSPYSPDFNPIEEAFSSIKAWIRRNRAAVRAAAEDGHDQLCYVLGEALMSVTPEKARGWFSHSGYLFGEDA